MAITSQGSMSDGVDEDAADGVAVVGVDDDAAAVDAAVKCVAAGVCDDDNDDDAVAGCCESWDKDETDSGTEDDAIDWTTCNDASH